MNRRFDAPKLGNLRVKLLLLPGMDGTGELFEEFIAALPDWLESEVVRYPRDVCLPYSELISLATEEAPFSEPFVLLAESFSTPIAIQFAAAGRGNLKGVVLCAGFATSPARGWRRAVARLLAPSLFLVALPDFLARVLLVGPDAPPELLAKVRTAVQAVKVPILSARLRAILDCDARRELALTRVPILSIVAGKDRLVPASCGEEMRLLNSGIAVETVDGPHLILQCKTRGDAEIVAMFVERWLRED